MLYLKKFQNFKIILRGKPVEQYNIADELQYSTIVSYKPQVATIKEVFHGSDKAFSSLSFSLCLTFKIK